MDRPSFDPIAEQITADAKSQLRADIALIRAAVEKHKLRTAQAVLEIDGYDWPVTIEYDAAPSESRTRNCAGYPGYVDIIRVVDDATGKPIPLPAEVIESLTKDIREGAI